MIGDRVFVDTNVLVYAYDSEAGEKHEKARAVLMDLWGSRKGATSTQVLQEFYVTVTRKLPKPLTRRVAREVVDTYRAWPVHRPEVDDVISASELEERHHMSFWDALVIISARQSDAQTILSEDLQDGRRISGLVISNPFATSVADE
ncbi:MAG: PIN domain-containing protein [Acidimicrobiales bacterium]|jgi:predicted nucleic acid-binding protein